MAIDEPPASGKAQGGALPAKQAGVVAGAAAGVIGTILVFSLGPRPLGPLADQARPLIAAAAALGPLLALIVAVGALANYRFFSERDIDAAAGGPPSERVRRFQAVLQNTMEQAVLAIGVYGLLALLLPARQLALPLVMAGAFVVGRLAFALGYRFGGPGRAFGFGLTFYPTFGGLAYAASLMSQRLPALLG